MNSAPRFPAPEGAIVLVGISPAIRPIRTTLEANHQAIVLRWTLDDRKLSLALLGDGLLVVTHVRTLTRLREVRAWLKESRLRYYVAWCGPDRPWFPQTNDLAFTRRHDADFFIERIPGRNGGWALRFTLLHGNDLGPSAEF